MVYAFAIFWIVVAVLTTTSLGVMANPTNVQVFAQGNDTAEMMDYSGNMTSTTNATSTDSGENATSDDTGSISRTTKA